MINRNSILNELYGLESTLANIILRNIYVVPDGYFDSLANQILNRIKAFEASDPIEELQILSPDLSDISKKMPNAVPAGYFEILPEKLMQCIRKQADYQTRDEELASLSPLLSSIRKKAPYSVPEGYFENSNSDIRKKEQAKIISIASSKWYRFASAAAIIGIIAMGGWLLINQKQIDPAKNPQAWIEKNMKKKVSQEQLDEFVSLAKGDENLKDISGSDSIKEDEIKELMKDVSDKEIREFLNEAVVLASNDEADIMLK